MDGVHLTVRLAVLMAGGLLLGLTVAALVTPHKRPPVPLMAGGAPMALPDAPGAYDATWLDARWVEEPVILFVVPVAVLEGVEAAHGPGEATPSIAVPGHPGLRAFALSGRSTGNGCTLSFRADLGASREVPDYDGDGRLDGRALDVCHHGQWDVYHRAEPVPGTPASRRLPALDLFLKDGRLHATGFDGRPGPPP